jgi:hypothetical protein
MDFSSVPRALESLMRRQPALDEVVLTAASKLLETKDSSVVLKSLQDLVTIDDASVPGKLRWEPLAVGLYIATEALNHLVEEDDTKKVYMEGPRVPSMTPSEKSTFYLPALSQEESLELCQTLHVVALKNLEHDEPRVRTLVAKCVGAYSKVSLQSDSASSQVMRPERQEMHARLISSIHEHIAAGRDETGAYSRASTGALDDTTGWRALETNWLCLASLVTALGGDFLTEFPLTDEVLEDCEFSCVTHVNRHVRAAGMTVLEKWIVAAASSGDTHTELLTSKASQLRKTTCEVLKVGLADNWSQVRMAASVLCRIFFNLLNKLDSPFDDLYPVLLPRMCLNRFYLAQGVKLYSHETWKIIFADTGLKLVVNHLGAVCRYYVKMCDADNHVVREAACQAVAELAVRLGEHDEYHHKLEPFIDLLLQALLMCFHDESWPVRDEACLACGFFCKAYPEECRPELNTLWERWTEQLTDQIWSVREDAAVALGNALQAYGPEFLVKIRELIAKLLPMAKEQPAMTPSEYKARQNDTEAHTDSQLYSCGSLAPKMNKRKEGAGRIGCGNCDVNRPKAPWEATDGCLYLISQIYVVCTAEDSKTPLSDDELLALMQEVADVCRVKHFPQADEMRATLWRQLPIIAHALGKQKFKRLYLDVFMELLFSSLESRSSSQLSRHAAAQCAQELAEFVGPAIFRARLEDYQQEIYDGAMRERSLLPRGPPDAFSPFGPPGLLDTVGTRYSETKTV